VEFGFVSVKNKLSAKKPANPDTIRMYAEDIVGWNNEGIRIDFPKEIFSQKLKDKEFKVLVSPFSVSLDLKEA
jgi:hypothetical protein